MAYPVIPSLTTDRVKKMIKKWFVLALVMATCLAPAAADEEKFPVSLEQKLGAGLINAATGWMEIVKTPVDISKKEGLGMGLTVGLAKGLFNVVGRTFWGVFDVVTFILPTKPMVEPHMIWQDFDKETRYKNRFETFKD